MIAFVRALEIEIVSESGAVPIGQALGSVWYGLANKGLWRRRVLGFTSGCGYPFGMRHYQTIHTISQYHCHHYWCSIYSRFIEIPVPYRQAVQNGATVHCIHLLLHYSRGLTLPFTQLAVTLNGKGAKCVYFRLNLIISPPKT
ncbi:unnamed protein product [Oppiella nova]|uniref:Uncharacterized protein n=1 Tax=Oppiella nova TaxID=334625 RepID=A0A7R9QNG5_9ACAR|nr:unnamed protein product [Oppiella nova]CAG2169528.1 unnamed protein product [Oppiella nova]